MPEEKQPNATPEKKGEPSEIKEEDLLKSLEKLEGKKEEPPAKEEPKVVVQKLEKSAKDTVAEAASPELKKALEVSTVLKEAVDLMGLHTDNSLQTLQKSIQAAAERDQKVVTVLEKLAKSLDDNTAALNKLLEKPASTPASRAAQVDPKTALEKSTAKETKTETNPVDVRKKVLAGLEILTKSCTPGSQDSLKYTRAAVKLETTGKIDEQVAGEALEAYHKKVGGQK